MIYYMAKYCSCGSQDRSHTSSCWAGIWKAYNAAK